MNSFCSMELTKDISMSELWASLRFETAKKLFTNSRKRFTSWRLAKILQKVTKLTYPNRPNVAGRSRQNGHDIRVGTGPNQRTKNGLARTNISLLFDFHY